MFFFIGKFMCKDCVTKICPVTKTWPTLYILAINCKVESRPEQVVVLFPGARLQGDSLLRQCLIETKDDT